MKGEPRQKRIWGRWDGKKYFQEEERDKTPLRCLLLLNSNEASLIGAESLRKSRRKGEAWKYSTSKTSWTLSFAKCKSWDHGEIIGSTSGKMKFTATVIKTFMGMVMEKVKQNKE